MKSIILAVLLVAVANAALSESEYQNAFVSWMKMHNKSYAMEEFLPRFAVFKSNLDFVNTHNADSTQTFKVAMNKFADLTAQEFGTIYNGFRMPAQRPAAPEYVSLLGAALPDSKDWRTAGAVTPIKNQEQCGSCWSFSTTGSVEGCHKLATNNLVSLSEKNLMDCSWSQGNQGCNGGLMTSAMDYIISNKGIDTEASYPYSAVSSHTCKYNSANLGATLSKYSNVKEGDENGLQSAVNTAPVSVAIDASHNSFQLYSSGVYYERSCSASQLDHGVLAVGWGVQGSSDYWIVKNSWGTDWGQDGYIWMSRNKNNNCGIATMATLPTSCN